tara:strand:- start:2209 stop:4449 length:2241 start_codon:yes stop_codon:yes gene_type:complete
MSSDRIDMQGIQAALAESYALTPNVLVNACIDDKYQNNIKYLEDCKCNVGQLKLRLMNQIKDDNENAVEFGYAKNIHGGLVPPDMGDLMSYIEKFASSSNVLPSFEDVLNFILEENRKDKNKFDTVVFALRSAGYNPQIAADNSKYRVINKYCTDLVIQAKNNRLDPLIGREGEVERMIEILAHYKKKNPLLVGEAGVGKTAVVEGLASAIAQDLVPEAIRGAKIFSTSIARLLAGTKFRGDVEEKVGNLLEELKKHEQEQGVPTYLFIDEIHQIVGAGSNSSNQDGSNIANIIKPDLASGAISLIGATTSKEYKRTIQKDDALSRRLQVVRIKEPSDKETIEILRKGVSPVLSEYHGVKYSKKVIEKAVYLSSKYITDKAQPDKSISILDSVGARLRTTESRVNARVSDVENLISTITGTPVSAFKDKSKEEEYVDIEAKLKSVIFGQAEAVSKIAEIYERSKAGLSEAGQPIGSVLAVGPTGVGKTEVARSLAKVTDSHFLKVNMGEYTEEHSVAKLFGAPPGYVGHKEGGLLTNEIRKNPHTIILLDEIEKAHKKVFEALLGIIDGAKMVDGEGNSVDFTNTFIIMTSNVGAANSAARKIINLSGKESLLSDVKSQVSMKALESTFSPEFRNKLTSVINFNSLGKEEIRLVTDKFLKKAASKLKSRKNIKIKYEDSIYDYISKEGFNPAFGARPVKKLIDVKIVDQLVKPLLKGTISKGDTLVFTVDELGEVVYSKEEETVKV